jgi:hypothetical protein
MDIANVKVKAVFLCFEHVSRDGSIVPPFLTLAPDGVE